MGVARRPWEARQPRAASTQSTAAIQQKRQRQTNQSHRSAKATFLCRMSTTEETSPAPDEALGDVVSTAIATLDDDTEDYCAMLDTLQASLPASLSDRLELTALQQEQQSTASDGDRPAAAVVLSIQVCFVCCVVCS